MPAAGTDDVDAVDDRDQLERAFRRLTVEQRAVIVWHHYLDLSRTDIAGRLRAEALGARHGRHLGRRARRAPG